MLLNPCLNTSGSCSGLNTIKYCTFWLLCIWFFCPSCAFSQLERFFSVSFFWMKCEAWAKSCFLGKGYWTISWKTWCCRWERGRFNRCQIIWRLTWANWILPLLIHHWICQCGCSVTFKQRSACLYLHGATVNSLNPVKDRVITNFCPSLIGSSIALLSMQAKSVIKFFLSKCIPCRKKKMCSLPFSWIISLGFEVGFEWEDVTGCCFIRDHGLLGFSENFVPCFGQLSIKGDVVARPRAGWKYSSQM